MLYKSSEGDKKMSKCPKCGEEKDARGFKKHVEKCKGTQEKPIEEKQVPEPEKPESEEIINQVAEEESEKPEPENQVTEEETDNENNTGTFTKILAALLGIIALFFIVIMTRGKEDAR